MSKQIRAILVILQGINETLNLCICRSKIPQVINPIKINRKSFQHSEKIVILIHGYAGNRDGPPNNSIRPALLKYKNVNVISVDYAPLVKYPCYFEAVQNVRLVANCLSQMINVLVGKNIVKNANLHVIGFGLGAQVAAP
ncbi:hypothetical protein AWZ03_007539 [Drosophila navojoa]|uniref:Lipase domain-containing protein n=1 Tax=Drosophila navojoa TaxID=7232 RepID=A0A484BB90_DRONA|nr:phospholipase A1 2-like [Drosophila navojoa]TDG46008.1 hypothetical protein AWZ03_007539 [Drosophila navojoa]